MLPQNYFRITRHILYLPLHSKATSQHQMVICWNLCYSRNLSIQDIAMWIPRKPILEYMVWHEKTSWRTILLLKYFFAFHLLWSHSFIQQLTQWFIWPLFTVTKCSKCFGLIIFFWIYTKYLMQFFFSKFLSYFWNHLSHKLLPFPFSFTVLICRVNISATCSSVVSSLPLCV